MLGIKLDKAELVVILVALVITIVSGLFVFAPVQASELYATEVVLEQ